MKSLDIVRLITTFSSSNSSSRSTIFLTLAVASPSFVFSSSSSLLTIPAPKRTHRSVTALRSRSLSNSQIGDAEEEPDSQVEDLRVPELWLEPSKAREESDWLRVTLHKWLDDEYCPEATNVEISEVAASSYYKSLTEKQTDLGEILLKMARELETISYQESFHGAFSSANAAINLIAERIDQQATCLAGRSIDE